MTTAIVSDLHLGARSKRPIAEDERARAALLERLDGVDHLVLLGDLLELREAPVGDALRTAEPVLRDLGAALPAGARVTLVPGNHDHQLADPLLDAWRLNGARGALALDGSMPAPPDGPVGRIAECLGGPDLVLAYPGTWVRDDVFATHGHYLDVHNTVPAIECLGIAATRRVLGPLAREPRDAADYEAALGPLYSLTYAIAQATGGRAAAGASGSVAIWQRLDAGGLGAKALTGLAIPAAVGALNMAGLGPFKPDLSGPELRRAALRGIATALGRLGVDAPHAVFGHTHRSGPWPGDDAAEWELRGGGRLLNSGSWVLEPAFVRDGASSPYWPGTCVFVDGAGPPRLERLLDSIP